MSGTREGGRKAAETNLKRHGKNFYAEIGRKGGSKGTADGTIKGFAAMTPEKRRAAGAKGGKISRRGPAKKTVEKKPIEKKVEEDIKKIEEGNRIRESFFRKMFRRNK